MKQASQHGRVAALKAIAGLCAVAMLATACGSDDESASASVAASAGTTATSATAAESPPTTAATATESSPATADADFPVSIENMFGTAEIESRPERVVSIGYTDGDYVVALGVTPVAIRDWYGGQPGGLWPWAAESAAANGDIEMLSSEQIEFEKIATAEPDVIIAIGSEIEQADYDKLSAIAPVVARSDDYIQFGTPWDVMQLTIGRALGLEAEAQAIVDDVTEQIAAVADEHPAWAGLAANVAAVSADGSSFAYTEGDNRGRLLTELGFTIPAAVGSLAGDLFYASISAEQISMLDGDLLMYTTFAASDKEAVEALPLFQGLGVVAAGHTMYLDAASNGAMSFATTLSIPYALGAIVPAIVDALGAESGADAGDGAIAAGEDPDVDAVVAAYRAVFDSATTFDQKAPYLPDAESVRATIESYVVAGEAVGGIKLEPTAVTIEGDTATVTYDVLFAGTAVYTALEGTAVNVDGAWVITSEEFCGFMSSARNPCP